MAQEWMEPEEREEYKRLGGADGITKLIRRLSERIIANQLEIGHLEAQVSHLESLLLQPHKAMPAKAPKNNVARRAIENITEKRERILNKAAKGHADVARLYREMLYGDD